MKKVKDKTLWLGPRTVESLPHVELGCFVTFGICLQPHSSSNIKLQEKMSQPFILCSKQYREGALKVPFDVKFSFG